MKNKTLYAILGIGAAYLIWRYIQKNKNMTSNIISPGLPDMPSVPASPIEQPNLRILEHGYDESQPTSQYSKPAIYTTYYGTINGTHKKVPVTC